MGGQTVLESWEIHDLAELRAAIDDMILVAKLDDHPAETVYLSGGPRHIGLAEETLTDGSKVLNFVLS